MNIFIYAPNPRTQIEIPFALERVCLRRSGGQLITLDILAENHGNMEVDALRIAIANPLVDVSGVWVSLKVTSLKDWIASERRKPRECNS